MHTRADGTWLARAAAALDLAVLIFIGQIFAGLSHLDMAAVGYATALTVGALVGGLLLWWQRSRVGRPLPCTTPLPRHQPPIRLAIPRRGSPASER